MLREHCFVSSLFGNKTDDNKIKTFLARVVHTAENRTFVRCNLLDDLFTTLTIGSVCDACHPAIKWRPRWVHSTPLGLYRRQEQGSSFDRFAAHQSAVHRRIVSCLWNGDGLCRNGSRFRRDQWQVCICRRHRLDGNGRRQVSWIL